VERDKMKLVLIFESMETDVLAPHRRHVTEYIPLIRLGYFGMEKYDLTVQSVARLDESRYNEGMRKVEEASLEYETQVDR
jgi:hypothetical protein